MNDITMIPYKPLSVGVLSSLAHPCDQPQAFTGSVYPKKGEKCGYKKRMKKNKKERMKLFSSSRHSIHDLGISLYIFSPMVLSGFSLS